MNQLQRLAVRSLPRVQASPLARVSLLHSSSPSSSTPTRSLSTTTPTEPETEAPAPAIVFPYKAKKVWPPDFTRLSPQEQLRFEKRYKRRVAIRSERPRWIKFVKLAQLFSITFVVIYGVLFMEWDYGPQPFAGLRAWFWETLGMVTGRQPQPAVQKADSEKR